MARIKPEFDKRNVKIIGLSVDPVDRHSGWAKDIEETQGTAPNYPIYRRSRTGDLQSCTRCCPAEAKRRPVQAHRGPTIRPCAMSYVIGPDKKLKLILVYR
jgi:alkyl hydroperoxide reductase subunit AhpC